MIHNLQVKFESDWAKTVVAIVSTRSYTQRATVDLDLLPRNPKSIGLITVVAIVKWQIFTVVLISVCLRSTNFPQN